MNKSWPATVIRAVAFLTFTTGVFALGRFWPHPTPPKGVIVIPMNAQLTISGVGVHFENIDINERDCGVKVATSGMNTLFDHINWTLMYPHLPTSTVEQLCEGTVSFPQ